MWYRGDKAGYVCREDTDDEEVSSGCLSQYGDGDGENSSEHEGANYEEECCAEGWFIGYKYKESSNGDFVKKEVNQDYTEDKACTSAIRQLTYDVAPDAPDEYIQMGAKTFCDALQAFCKAIMDLYGDDFLRRPTYTDVEKLMGDQKPHPFILLEAVTSQDLWICHAFFGVSGTKSDVNVIRQSPVFNDLKDGKTTEVPFVANDVTCK
nr:hypothetical protein [Tanacetum cinerariifolium]